MQHALDLHPPAAILQDFIGPPADPDGSIVGLTVAGAADLAATKAELVIRLARVVEFRDDASGAHVRRVSRSAAALASSAGLGSSRCALIRYSSALHDVGKVAIPDAILLKPGRLDNEEWAVMKTHARVGYDLLRNSCSAVLRLGATIAWAHHERYDGTGYPRGLRAEEIPVEGRILAIADVYDALCSDRVYRSAFERGHAREILTAGRGSHFDPELLDLFLAHVADVAADAWPLET